MSGRAGRGVARVVLLVAAVAATAALAPPAGAHGDAGTLGIEVTAPVPLTVHVRTLLRYAADGHTVPGAVVTVTASGPDGRSAGPLTLADTGDGTYSGDLPVPVAGAWSVAAEATAPAASARADVTVSATPAPTTTPSPTRERGTTPTTVRRGGAAGGAGDDPLVPIVRYLVVVLGVAIITATLVVGLRRRR